MLSATARSSSFRVASVSLSATARSSSVVDSADSETLEPSPRPHVFAIAFAPPNLHVCFYLNLILSLVMSLLESFCLLLDLDYVGVDEDDKQPFDFPFAGVSRYVAHCRGLPTRVGLLRVFGLTSPRVGLLRFFGLPVPVPVFGLEAPRSCFEHGDKMELAHRYGNGCFPLRASRAPVVLLLFFFCILNDGDRVGADAFCIYDGDRVGALPCARIHLLCACHAIASVASFSPVP